MLNWLIQIPGPSFLIYFSLFSIGCIVAGWFWIRTFDNSTSYSLPTLTRFNATGGLTRWSKRGYSNSSI